MTHLKVGDKVDDLILGAKTAIANLKTFFGNWVGKLKIADKVDDLRERIDKIFE